MRQGSTGLKLGRPGWLLLLAATLLTVSACGRDSGAPDTPEAAPAGGDAAGAIVPFSIDVPDAVLDDLRERLSRARYPGELDGAGWTYGTSLGYLRELVAYWRDEFDWREQERRLNRFDQFKTNIDGLDVHFVHQRAADPDALPVIIVHGWPSSFMQFHKVIEPLTDPAAHGGSPQDAFHVVAPSIPGYGFSDKPRERGYGPAQMGDIFIKLMARLGYTRYGLQGGDWGGPIVAHMARADAEHVVGMHTETCRGGPPEGVEDPTAGVPPEELERMRDRQAFFSDEERGYSAIQGSKPQTLGYGLNDSAVGQAAWIVEKFRAWSDVNGDVESKFTKDELLTNITIYWVTQTATSSARLYYESPRQGRAGFLGAGRIEVPTGCAAYPRDVGFTPRLWNEARYNVTRFTIMPRGGHFAALEEPELYLDDVRAFFRGLR